MIGIMALGFFTYATGVALSLAWLEMTTSIRRGERERAEEISARAAGFPSARARRHRQERIDRWR